jgi:hypothetical protein
MAAQQGMNQGGWPQQQGYPQQQFQQAMQPQSGPFQGAYQQPQQQFQPQSAGYQMGPPSGQQQVVQPPNNFQRSGPPSQPFPMPGGPPSQPFAQQQAPAGEAFSTWGPPQSSSWARGDSPPGGGSGPDLTQPTVRSSARSGPVGTTLETDGLEGEQLSIKLVEVVDPADYLFTAAGYRLQEGERSVVVHTELRNRGTVSFSTLPDLYLVLVTPDGRSVAKAPVSLSSRPPHRIGVAPGETAGGHTVYVLPEETDISSVRWSPRPDDEKRSLTWNITR